MISFDYPWNLFWFLPFFIFWWYFCRERKAWALLIIFALSSIVLMKPYLNLHSESPLLVIVFDRSASVISEQDEWAKKSIKKILTLATSDKIAIVTFGKNVAIEKWFDEDFDGEIYRKHVDPESSSLNDALLMANSLVPSDKAGKILMITDGQYRGVSPLIAATESKKKNVKIDFLPLENNVLDDVGISEIRLPNRVSNNEMFQLSVELFATQSHTVKYELRRLGETIYSDKVDLPKGQKVLSFVDKINRIGSFIYDFHVFYDNDALPQNNSAKGILQVEGQEKILQLNTTGLPDNFTRALQGSGKEVRVLSPKETNIDLGLLEAYQLIVIENVPADQLKESTLKAIQVSVENYGKSLLMTGGRASFGMGGYLNSVLDPILPINMIAKNDKIKLSTGVSIILDRSGSMSMQISLNRTMMDLANEGANSVLDLLDYEDEISVLAVDTSPHIVIPMSKISKSKAIFSNKILSIESLGGGIFTYTGIKAGAQQLQNSKASTRHLILFADANDAEEYGDSIEFVKRLYSTGVTVSVVAMGNQKSKDSEFLKQVAEAGGGRWFFAEDVTSLPRLFTQDVIQVKRNSFLEEETTFSVGTGLSDLGNFPFLKLPSVNGINSNYIKDGAQLLYLANNENSNPIISAWNVGAGRAMSISFEVDGAYTGDFAMWERYDQFFAGLARYLIPHENNTQAVLTATRQGHQVNVQLLVDPNDIVSEEIYTDVFYGESLQLHKRIPLRLLEEGVYQGQYNLEDATANYHLSSYKGKPIKGNAVILPFNPEFEQMLSPLVVTRTMDNIVNLTGGMKIHLPTKSLFEDAIPIEQKIDIINPILFFIIFFLMIEILQKRAGFHLLDFSRYKSYTRRSSIKVIKKQAEDEKASQDKEVLDPFTFVKQKTTKK